ncbi:MAG: cupin-like domain-containing protein, partial [Verrucomicrobiota bacterium]
MSESETRTIERRSGLSPDAFNEEYLLPRKPVILEDAISDWPAATRWTPDFFRETYGDRQVTIDDVEYALRDVIDLALASDDENPAPYYRNISVQHDYPELEADLLPTPGVYGKNWFESGIFTPLRKANVIAQGGEYELFIGGAGRAFPILHYDAPGADTFLTQIYGEKRLIVFSPEDTEYLYPRSGSCFNLSEVNVEAPDLEAHPRYTEATPLIADLKAGDIVFMPYGWWHTAKMLSFSITVGIDVANGLNWPHIVDFLGR